MYNENRLTDFTGTSIIDPTENHDDIKTIDHSGNHDEIIDLTVPVQTSDINGTLTCFRPNNIIVQRLGGVSVWGRVRDGFLCVRIR